MLNGPPFFLLLSIICIIAIIISSLPPSCHCVSVWERWERRERQRDREKERVCNVLQHQLGMTNITSTAIRLMLPSISLMEMCSAYKAAKHFSSGNVLSIYYKAAKHFSSGYALSLTKLPSISIAEMCSAYHKAAKHFIIWNELSLKLPVNSLFKLSSAVRICQAVHF